MRFLTVLPGMVCTLFPLAPLSAEKMPPISEYEVSRVGQLMGIFDLQNSSLDRHRKLAGLDEKSVDIQNISDIGKNGVFRLWSFGHGLDRLRVMTLSSDGILAIEGSDSKERRSKRVNLTIEQSKDFLSKMKSILNEPIIFRMTRITETSNGTSYLLESYENGKYQWAVRRVNYCPSEDYSKIDDFAGYLTSILEPETQPSHIK